METNLRFLTFPNQHQAKFEELALSCLH